MNSQSSPQHIPCAVIYAGTDAMLTLEARPGRFPIQVTCAGPRIEWTCDDGLTEYIEFEGETALSDQSVVMRDLGRNDLLVAEVGDLHSPDMPAASFFLVNGPYADRRLGERE